MDFHHPTRSLAAIVVVAVGCFATASARASLMINDVNATYTIDFDSTVAGVNNGPYSGTGISPMPNPGQLDSSGWASTGWTPNGTGVTAFDGGPYMGEAHARGQTDVPQIFGGFWSFDVDSGPAVNRTLGVQPNWGEWTPGTITLRLQNLTGYELTEFSLAYQIYVRNDAGRVNSMNLAHSADDATYTLVPALDFLSPGAADADGWIATPRSTTFTGLSIPNNGFYYLEWYGDDVSGSGNPRDEFALDDITVSNFVANVPEPTAGALAGVALLGLAGAVRRRASLQR